MAITIAIDAMGGDFGPSVTVLAALKVLAQQPDLSIILVGNESAIAAQLAVHKAKPTSRLRIQHASQEVSMAEQPAKALRLKKDSSIRVAINLVKDSIAQACVSAGNTGALMATARFVLKTLPGVDRPAILAQVPTNYSNKTVRILDLGANVDCTAENLYEFAVMGSVVANHVDHIAAPRVGLLNIGSEEMKGNEQVKRSAELLAASPHINYIGFVEGTDLFLDKADVVVCDGFVGNVALKILEGTMKLVSVYLEQGFKRNLYNRISGLFARPALKYARSRMDPGRYNGAGMVGLQGIVIKSHGGANVQAFVAAINYAVNEARQNIPECIKQKVAQILSNGE